MTSKSFKTTVIAALVTGALGGGYLLGSVQGDGQAHASTQAPQVTQSHTES